MLCSARSRAPILVESDQTDQSRKRLSNELGLTEPHLATDESQWSVRKMKGFEEVAVFCFYVTMGASVVYTAIAFGTILAVGLGLL